MRRGWFFGSGQLKEKLLERMSCAMGKHHGGIERQESDEQKAERLLLGESKKRGWTEEDLEELRKSDAIKVKMVSG